MTVTTWPEHLPTLTVAIDIGGPGVVTITGPVITVAEDDVVLPRVHEVIPCNPTGSVVLPKTNAPGILPADFSYAVDIRRGDQVDRGTLSLDTALSGPVQLADLLQLGQDVLPGQSYIRSTARGVAGGVAALDEDGDVTDAQGNKITGGEGGSGPSPGNTVVTEQAFGQSATAGTGTAYARSTHSHGTPTAPTAASVGADPSGTAATALSGHVAALDPHTQYAVSAELGDAAMLDVGTTNGTVAAGDDSRITGAQQRSTLTTKGDLYVATGSGTVARVGVGVDDQVLTADSGAAAGVAWADPPAGGGGAAATVEHGYVTSGDLSATDTSGSWVIMDAALQFTIAAAAGDEIRADLACLFDQNNSLTDWFELVVIKSAAIARFASTGSSTPAAAGEGDPSIYPVAGGRFRGSTPWLAFTAASGDIAAGTITFGVAHKGPGGGKVFASTDRPYRWTVRNDGQ